MKRSSIPAALVLTLITLLSVGCSKSKNSSIPGGSTNWTWSGTAPLSVDIDNKAHYQAFVGSVLVSPSTGITNITSGNGSDTSVIVSFTGTPTAGAVYNCPSPASISFIVPAANHALYIYEASSGSQIKILSVTDSTIEGEFYGTVKDTTGSSSATHSLTNGYFKVAR